MNKLQQLHWPLIIGLGALALIMPFMNISGLMNIFGRPFGPLLVMTFISLLWLTIVITNKVRQPIVTLTCAGFVYGLIAFVLGTLLGPIVTGEAVSPATNPVIRSFALTSILVTNTLWGFTVGFIAWGIQQVTQPTTARKS